MGKKRVIKKNEEIETVSHVETGGSAKSDLVSQSERIGGTSSSAASQLSSEGDEIKKIKPIEVGTRQKFRVTQGRVYIQATYNNTLITITDKNGDVISWSSAGSLGFSGAKKATPFVAARVAESAVFKARKSGIQEVIVLVSGMGSGRDSAIRSLANQGLNLVSVKDITPLPHNGPRPKKVRRV